MQWSEAYSFVSNWVFDHQVETDVIVVSGIVGAIAMSLRQQRRRRRRWHRHIWGKLMKRKDLEKYIQSRFEDALVDAAMEMVHDGTMTPLQEKKAYLFFAEKLGFTGLKPSKDVKKGIATRLRKRFGLKPVLWFGPKPGVERVDKSYDPNKPIPEGLSASKYITA